MKKEELQNMLAKHRDRWQVLTTITQDLNDSYIKSLTIDELNNRLEWYESLEAYESMQGWIDKYINWKKYYQDHKKSYQPVFKKIKGKRNRYFSD